MGRGTRSSTIPLQWIPSHIGLRGNEHVDKLAKQALADKQNQINVKLSYSELRSMNCAHIKETYSRYIEEEYQKHPAAHSLVLTPILKLKL